MVKLTLELVARATSRHTQRRRDETVQQFVRRITHLHLENKNIDAIGDDLCMCRNLVVLYMYDNQLSQVPLLGGSSTLTHLYLQNNNITKIDNLSPLTRLQKLFLGGNIIGVVEGLDKLEQLEELHVENQRLAHGEQLLFDPRSLEKISKTLQVLNISGNHLTQICELDKLYKLTQLTVSNNRLSDMKEMSELLASLNFLCQLDLTGNPLCQTPKYKDQIIVVSKNLEVLDGKTVTATERQFLVNWKASRELQAKKLQDHLMRQDTFASVSSESLGRRRLPPVKNVVLRQSSLPASATVQGLARMQLNEILDKYNLMDATATTKYNLMDAAATTGKVKSGPIRTKTGS